MKIIYLHCRCNRLCWCCSCHLPQPSTPPRGGPVHWQLRLPLGCYPLSVATQSALWMDVLLLLNIRWTGFDKIRVTRTGFYHIFENSFLHSVWWSRELGLSLFLICLKLYFFILLLSRPLLRQKFLIWLDNSNGKQTRNILFIWLLGLWFWLHLKNFKLNVIVVERVIVFSLCLGRNRLFHLSSQIAAVNVMWMMSLPQLSI